MANISESIGNRLCEMILEAIFLGGGSGFSLQFIVRRPGAPASQTSGIVVDLSINKKKMLIPALLLRKCGPVNLRYMPMEEVFALISDFITENYWLLLDEVLFKKSDLPFSKLISESSKKQWSEQILFSKLLNPSETVTIYPLDIVKVDFDFDGQSFYLIKPESLDDSKLVPGFPAKEIRSGRFPLIADHSGPGSIPSAWLGVRAPSYAVASKMKSGILGALALTPVRRERHAFVSRRTTTGRCTFEKGATTSYHDTITPSLSSTIVITKEDSAWLKLLASKIKSEDKVNRRQINALEYYYRAWFLPPHERFAHHCMSIDAIYGDADKATEAIVSGVAASVGASIPGERIRLLMAIRGSVVHGRAPDVYDAKEYTRYYKIYQTDPIVDLELVANQCLRTTIFGDCFRQQPDPHAEQLAKAQSMGIIPKNFDEGLIIVQ